MGEFFHAVGVFFDHLAGVGWTALAIGLALHFARLLTRTVAWRNILAASYPNERWRWIPIAKAYIGGVGINSIVPGRAGDVVKLYLVHREQPATTYTTLASTLVTETLLDLVLATLIFLWALTQGVLPSLHVLPNIPSFDWGWLFANQRATAIAVVALTIAAVWFLHWASVHIADFKQRVGQGFAILRDRGRYGREVVSWQLLSWVLRIASLYWFLRAFHVHASVHNALPVLGSGAGCSAASIDARPGLAIGVAGSPSRVYVFHGLSMVRSAFTSMSSTAGGNIDAGAPYSTVASTWRRMPIARRL